jgi:cell division septation protein DedD
MEKKHHLFIYDRKELGVLVLLGVMVAVFAFTLGVHLGKRVGVGGRLAPAPEATTAITSPDQLPNRQEFQEQSKAAQQAVDESLNQALHDEVARTGIKMDAPRQVELPEDPKGAGAASAMPKKSKFLGTLQDIPAAQRAAPQGRFTLQIGSHNVVDEAKDQVDAVEALGFKPFLRAAEIRGKGKWYRVYVGGFFSRTEAEKAGQRYKSQHAIDSYIVAKITE